MSESDKRKSLLDPDGPSLLELIPPVTNGWQVALGVMAIVLVIGGVITAVVGLGAMGQFEGAVLGQNPGFDQSVATGIVGGVTIFLGVLVATVWLAIGAIAYRRGA